MRQRFLIVFSLLLYSFSISSGSEVIEAEWNKLYTYQTEPDSSLTIFRFPVEKSDIVARVVVSSNDSDLDSPLLAVFRERKAVMSLQVPIIIQKYEYNVAGRTLCPFSSNRDPERLTVEFSSYKKVRYNFRATLLEDFNLKTGIPHQVTASASQPVYLQYDIPEDVDSVFVHVDSDSHACTTVSIQPIGCPVFDLTNNVISGGMHQTMSTSATITVERKNMPQFYVIFVVNPNNNYCSEMADIVPKKPTRSPIIMKNMNITVEWANNGDYVIPLVTASSVIAVIYFFAIAYMIADYRMEMKFMEQHHSFLDHRTATQRIQIEEEIMRDDDSISSYDVLLDSQEKLVRRAKRNLVVADLSLKTWKQREKKYKVYLVSLATVGLFYGLPVVQLVLTWQNTVRLSGDLDLCYYNFRCAKPFFGNMGYILLGLLLVIMNKEKEVRYQRMAAKAEELETVFGLPQHGGVMNALSFAVILEGVLSASYHICPSGSNYQFDTSFMYVIGMLGMLKLYQLRHPDINANAHVAFAVVALFILIAMCGVYMHNLIFWAAFSLVYVVMMISVTAEFYFKGVWRIKFHELWNSIKYAYLSSRRCSCIRPTHAGRFLCLFLANVINLFFIAYGLWLRPKDFASFLLLPFIANLFLYLVYYIIMKIANRERIHPRAIIILLLSAVCWLIAGYFFLNAGSDWSKTPSISRELNRPCLVLKFFDNHDMWHFFSSIGIFLSFTLINRIDDDLMFTPRDEIVVF
ncbi:unnamed protein product [Caenorhabditis auriculariae]|uniref:SID1 transmembrane family member 1 n=1 Tax=Caenorhabditis auriculariae TaxID=2777116 RepID=A0A8S1GVT8_9PELO|nr:unnamed protein product [Caenorhabditis auriculariae]